MNDWQIGHEVYVVPGERRGEPYRARITKIGRKWVSFARIWPNGRLGSEDRFDALTGYIDGGAHSSPGSVYETEATYQAKAVRGAEWRAFKSKVDRTWGPPAAATRENIREATRLLFGED